MITLITAPPGCYKTSQALLLSLQYSKSGRPVYTNTKIIHDGIQQLPENDDWTKTPYGSVVIYDEAQNYSFLSSSDSLDKRFKDLLIHKHTGHDIILFAQAPFLLSTHLLSIVDVHCFSVPFHGQTSNVLHCYYWSKVVFDPYKVIDTAERHETHDIDEVFKCLY